MNVDVEIYMKNLIKFFEKNPNDLLNLIPQEKEKDFFSKIREKAEENFQNGKDITLTQNQMIEICREINLDFKSDQQKVEKPFFWTKYGIICLN